MKKLKLKLSNFNITWKLFLITSSLLLALTISIYLILYLSLPSYYEKYKLKNLDNILNSIIEYSKNSTTEELKAYSHYLSTTENLRITIFDENKNIIYGKPTPLNFNKHMDIKIKNKKHKYKNKHKVEYRNKISIKTKDSSSEYIIDIVMPLQPISEASYVINKLLPFILSITLMFALIGAYIYSITITKPLLKIIEIEREQENKRKQFIATISHELKTPITIISGQLEGMIYNIGKYKDRDLYLSKTYESTIELKQLVNEMMEISKMEILEQSINVSKVNLNELLSELIKKQTFLIEEKALKLKINMINKNQIVNVDRDKISRALNNIINNAIKYSPVGEEITIYIKDYKSHIVLEVRNSGITIPNNAIESLFNPFYRVEQSRCRKTGGSGLGLYITSQILKLHNLKYKIYNDENSVVFKIVF